MSAFTTRRELLQKMAMRGYVIPQTMSAYGAPTAAGATMGAGHWNVRFAFDSFGSTVPGTLVGLGRPPVTSNALQTAFSFMQLSGGVGWWLCWLYAFGTVNLAATGDQFTHDAATFPVLRTRMGQSSQAVPLIPIIYVTTATATTAPVITLKNVAGTNGYVDQDGNTVVGTRTLTFPAAATAAQTGLVPLLETTDYAVRDIVNIEVGTAGTAGAATLFGMEPIMPSPQILANVAGGIIDPAAETFFPADLRPALATSGTATAYLAAVGFVVSSNTASSVNSLVYAGSENA